jgi:multidrug efflux system membrane fusion protein
MSGVKFVFATLLALAAAVATAPAALAQRAPASVTALRSEAQPFTDTLVLRGRSEADRRVEVRAQIAGLIASPPIRKGAQVAAGDPLCVLDEGERPAALTEAQAAMKRMQVEYDAAARLLEKGFTAETESLSRAAALEAARAQVQRAEIAMDRLTIAAPFDGVLESDTAELGALMQPGDVCATLIALDPIKLVGFAPEQEVDRLQVGANATARLVSGQTAKGDIRFVARSADESTRTYRVEVVAPNPDLAIRDGMTAEISIAMAPQDAHLAPQSAMTLNDAGDLGVKLVRDGAARFHPVEVLSDTSQGVWLAGLPARADIITVGQEFVADGQPVTASFAPLAALR